jgi:MFS family permease
MFQRRAMPLGSFRAFRSRNYRLFFAGQCLSLLGTWMQKTAVSWVIYAQTHSTLMLGLSMFATIFPSALLSLLGGIVADRYPAYRILLLTQVLSLGQAALLALVVLLKPNAMWEILGLSAVLGCINAFDLPARQSLVYGLMEDKQDLPNAVALSSSMVNVAQLLGPALAGLVLARLGATACFSLNAFSFVAVIGSMAAMRLPAAATPATGRSLKDDLSTGFRYLQATPDICFIIVMMALLSLLVLPFATLLPAYAKDIFRGTATTFGVLEAAAGLGALAGTLFLASLKPTANLNKVLTANTFVFGTGLLLFAYTPWFPAALGFLALSSFGMMARITLNVTLLQTIVQPVMRGRIISLYILAFSAMLPLGSLLVGAVSQRIGVQPTILAEGVLAILLGLLHLRRP